MASKDMIDEEKKAADTTFEDSLFQTILSTNNNKESVILSPLSVLIAMTLCQCGAANETLREMLSVLHPNTNDKSLTLQNASNINAQLSAVCDYYNQSYSGKDKVPLITIANKIWLNVGQKVCDSFVKATGVASTQILNFSDAVKAAAIVNRWCSDNTQKMIEKVVEPDGIKDVSILIANAIYFKAKFVTPFVKKETKANTPFYADRLQQQQAIGHVSMMQSLQKPKSFAQKVCGVYDVVKLPYTSSQLSLVLAIVKYDADITPLPLSMDDIFSIQWKQGKINLFVPKFKFEFTLSLNDALKSMGIVQAFSDKADFSGMTGDKSLYISNVIHKAVIEVDEQGTEAAAVTVVKMKKAKCAVKKSRDPIITIRFDHIFDFYVVDDEKKNVLFSGRYVGK